MDIPCLYSCGVVGCQGVVQRRKSGRNEELSGGYLSSYHSRDKSFMDEKKESSDKSSETKVIVSPEGKHYIKMGSVVVTPEGKHIIVP